MHDVNKIIKSLENSGVLLDGVTKTVKHKIKKQESGFLGALLAPLAASLVQPVISSVVKGMWKRSLKSKSRIHEKIFLVLLHPLNNIEITNCFNYEPRFNDVFSKNNLARLKDGAHVIDLDGKNSKGTHYLSTKIQLYALIFLELKKNER